jgi:2'-5' RNA ligase
VARLFFAIWPDEPAARQLAALARDLAGRVDGKPVPQAKIHLTLAFLGEVAAERIEAARAIELDGPAFDLALDKVGGFREARVAWAGCAAPPAALLGLERSLAAVLRKGGFEVEDRPFAPHVTLVRRTRRAAPRLAQQAIAWRVREVALMRSELGTGRYSTLAAWPLRD